MLSVSVDICWDSKPRESSQLLTSPIIPALSMRAHAYLLLFDLTTSGVCFSGTEAKAFRLLWSTSEAPQALQNLDPASDGVLHCAQSFGP
jgi:hypothetical protein